MTVVFENKNSGKLIHHEGVAQMQTEETCLGQKGYGLHFSDNSYCLVNKESFRLVSVSI